MSHSTCLAQIELLWKSFWNSSLPFYSKLCCSFISFENLLWTFVNINIWIAFEGRDGFKLHFAFQIFLWWVPGWTDPYIRAFQFWNVVHCCRVLDEVLEEGFEYERAVVWMIIHCQSLTQRMKRNRLLIVNIGWTKSLQILSPNSFLFVHSVAFWSLT